MVQGRSKKSRVTQLLDKKLIEKQPLAPSFHRQGMPLPRVRSGRRLCHAFQFP